MSTIINSNGITTNQVDSTVINQNGVNVADDNELANVDAQVATKATLAEAQAYDLGVGQTWQDVTAGRSAGVTYTNTTGKPIMVAVKGSVNSSADIHIYINGVSIQSQQGTSSAATVPHSITTVIPNGANYKVTSTFAPIKWFELR